MDILENLGPGVQHNGTNGTNGQYWTNNSSGRGSISFKEENEYVTVENLDTRLAPAFSTTIRTAQTANTGPKIVVGVAA